MKLISVQSRGNRIVRICESEFSKNISISYFEQNPKNPLMLWNLVASGTVYDQEAATKSAAEWLKGARI